jgi:hypothetical protein
LGALKIVRRGELLKARATRTESSLSSSPPFFQKDLARFWKIGAIHKKIHTKRRPPKLVSLFPLAESFPTTLLSSPPLLAADRVGVDVHGDVAVGVGIQEHGISSPA